MPGSEHNEVQIHIDQQQYESPNPTTGAALYSLGHIGAELQLYQVVNGHQEDEPIENGSETVQLRKGDHFRSGPHKTYTVYINGEQKQVSSKKLEFDEIVKLAYPTPPSGDNILYTISYEDGPPSNSQGSLKAGESVRIKTGMVFNVTATDKS